MELDQIDAWDARKELQKETAFLDFYNKVATTPHIESIKNEFETLIHKHGDGADYLDKAIEKMIDRFGLDRTYIFLHNSRNAIFKHTIMILNTETYFNIKKRSYKKPGFMIMALRGLYTLLCWDEVVEKCMEINATEIEDEKPNSAHIMTEYVLDRIKNGFERAKHYSSNFNADLIAKIVDNLNHN